MKKFLFMLCLIVLTTGNAVAQIKTVKAEPEETEYKLSYDSTDISLRNPQTFIGQRAIYFGSKYNGLYMKNYSNYRESQESYKPPVFTYFEVIDFEPPQTFKLKRVDNGDICYYTNLGDGISPIMLVAYFEKHKSKILNTEWIIGDRDSVWVIRDVYIKENSGIDYTATMKNDTTHINIKTLYGCRDMNRYYQLSDKYSTEEWVVDENNTYGILDKIQVVKGKVYFIFRSNSGKRYTFNADEGDKLTYNNGLMIGMLPLFKKSEAVEYIKRFGLSRWKQILNADVKIGMTKEMVLLSIGQPSQEISDTSTTGDISIWSYSYMDVYFRNGKVFSITEH